CVLVAKIVGLLADRELPITALELEPPLLRPHQARDQAKQGGLAHAIGAGDQQRFAPADRKAQTAEDLTAPPDASEVGPDEPQHPPAAPARGRCWSTYPPLKIHRRPASIGHVFGPDRERKNP